MYYLLQQRQHTKGQYVLITYTCAMFIVSTIYFCTAAKWSEMEFVESTVNPAAFASALSSEIAIAKDTASVVSIWLADSLIVCSFNLSRSNVKPEWFRLQIYRTYVVWSGNLWIIIVPCILFMGAVGLSSLLFDTSYPLFSPRCHRLFHCTPGRNRKAGRCFRHKAHFRLRNCILVDIRIIERHLNTTHRRTALVARPETSSVGLSRKWAVHRPCSGPCRICSVIFDLRIDIYPSFWPKSSFAVPVLRIV